MISFAISKDGFNIEHASEILKHNIDLCMLAVTENPGAFKLLPRDMRSLGAIMDAAAFPTCFPETWRDEISKVAWRDGMDKILLAHYDKSIFQRVDLDKRRSVLNKMPDETASLLDKAALQDDHLKPSAAMVTEAERSDVYCGRGSGASGLDNERDAWFARKAREPKAWRALDKWYVNRAEHRKDWAACQEWCDRDNDGKAGGTHALEQRVQLRDAGIDIGKMTKAAGEDDSDWTHEQELEQEEDEKWLANYDRRKFGESDSDSDCDCGMEGEAAAKDHGSDRGSERGSDRGSDCGSDRGSDRGSERGEEVETKSLFSTASDCERSKEGPGAGAKKTDRTAATAVGVAVSAGMTRKQKKAAKRKQKKASLSEIKPKEKAQAEVKKKAEKAPK